MNQRQGLDANENYVANKDAKSKNKKQIKLDWNPPELLTYQAPH